MYTNTSPHKDSQGKSDNEKEDIKHQEGDHLKLKLTPDNSSSQHSDGKSPDVRYKEQKEVLHKLYMDTTPSHKDSQGASHYKKEYMKDKEGNYLLCNKTLETSPHRETKDTLDKLKYQEPQKLLHRFYTDTPLSHKDRNGTSHNHNQYIKHDSTVHVQDPLTSHYPPGPMQPTGLWLPTTQHRQIYGEGEPVPIYTPAR